MQAALQAFVDNSLSKTVNFPDERHRGGRGHGLHAGLGTGLQGHHRLRDRLARKVVLETKATADKKQADEPQPPPSRHLHQPARACSS